MRCAEETTTEIDEPSIQGPGNEVLQGRGPTIKTIVNMTKGMFRSLPSLSPKLRPWRYPFCASTKEAFSKFIDVSTDKLRRSTI